MDNNLIGSIIAFENGKSYVVFETLVHDKIQYLYMATPNEPLEIMFAKGPLNTTGETDIVTISDKAEKEKVLQLLIEKSKKADNTK